NGPGISGRAVAIVGRLLFFGGLDGSIGGGALHRGIASIPVRQPDPTIATTRPAIGVNGFNATGGRQTRRRIIVPGHSGIFTIVVGNGGAVRDEISFVGSGSAPGYAATWKSGTTNITAQVVAGTYSRTLDPHTGIVLTLTVTVGVHVAHGST